jgi:hypothetical protein
MVSLSALTKEQLESVVRVAEWSAIILTFLGAASGVVFILANRPLRIFEAKERESSQAKIAGAVAVAEQERIARLNLEKSLAPRRIAVPIPNPRLEHFAGTPVRISYSTTDPETLLTAKRLKFALENAKWKVAMAADDTPHLGRSGVLIAATSDSVGSAAGQLDEFLTANFVEVMPWALPRAGAKLDWYPPRGMVVEAPLIWVVVAAKPDPYFERQAIDGRIREVQVRALEKLEAERAAKMRRLHDEWFPPGTKIDIR